MAVDINQDYIDIARQRLSSFSHVRVSCGDANDLEIEECFDTIILLDVLEHIEDDVGLLRRIAANLAPGGRLILKVPAIPWLYSELDQVIGHYRRYDRRALEDCVSRSGLISVKTKPANALGIFGWWLNGRVLGRTVPPSAQIGWFEKIVPAVAAVEKILGPPIGLSLLSLAQKPGAPDTRSIC